MIRGPKNRLPDGPLLLDTHAWIWYLDGRAQSFSPAALQHLQKLESNHGFLVSEMSVWEAANKASKGRLQLAPTPEIWIERATNLPGFQFLAPQREVLLLSTRLPDLSPTDPRDPVDRMLIATAMLQHVPLATADEGILEYAAVHGHLTTLDVRP
jgi:PIN domain nuclease of toxin-antitoxin system